MTTPDASAPRVRAQVELGVRDEQDPLEQVVEVRLLLRRDLRELRRASPLLGLEALRGQLAPHAVRVRVRDVDLVDRDDDRHLGRARVRDRLLRLRHDAVVGGDDEHRDVRDLRAARAHRREGLVAGRIEERDLPPVHLGLVRADVLRDPAGLGLDDGGLADRVEQRRLAVVDVPHDRHDRRPRREVLLGVLVLGRLDLLIGGVLDDHLALDLGGDDLDLLVRERLRRRPHLAEAHQDLDELAHRHAEGLRQVLDGGAGLHGDGARRRGDRLLLLARRPDSGAVARLPSLAAPSAAALDDHAPLPPAGTLAGANRAVGAVASVGHQA